MAIVWKSSNPKDMIAKAEFRHVASRLAVPSQADKVGLLTIICASLQKLGALNAYLITLLLYRWSRRLALSCRTALFHNHPLFIGGIGLRLCPLTLIGFGWYVWMFCCCCLPLCFLRPFANYKNLMVLPLEPPLFTRKQPGMHFLMAT